MENVWLPLTTLCPRRGHEDLETAEVTIEGVCRSILEILHCNNMHALPDIDQSSVHGRQ